MSGNWTAISVAMAEIRDRVRAKETLEERLREAMRLVQDHWMATAEDDRLKAAIGCVMDLYGQGSNEWERLEWEFRQLARLSTALQAAQLGMGIDPYSIEGMAEEMQQREPLGLMKMWREAKNDKR